MRRRKFSACRVVKHQESMMMQPPEKPKTRSLTAILIGIALLCLLMGGVLGYAISNFTTSDQINNLQSQVSNLKQDMQSNSSQISSLQTQVSDLEQELQSTQNSSTNHVTIVSEENVTLSQLYNQVNDSIVMVQGTVLEGYNFFGTPIYGGVEGSGFVTNLTGQFAIVTNFHVVQDAINVTVTFTDGNTYPANVTGTDLYSDLATLSTTAPGTEYHPLTIVSSSTLQVGDPVFAVGNPLGLTGSMTSGIVSALHRSVTVDWTTYAMADCVQTSAPINPGNSGGPLLNYAGEVVGITSYTATYEGVAAQGLGLAIPSSTILREVPSLILKGSYNSHPYLGASGDDMDYELAQAMSTNVTYGWLIAQVANGGPAATAGLRAGTTQFTDVLGNTYTIGGDIVIAFNGRRIANGDALSSYLEENTQPGQTINVTVVRNNQTINVAVKLGSRPAPA
jgi:S1-C subfamily serine protease